MVKKPVTKKEKKKSAKQLQDELKKKKLEAFNSAVGRVRDIFRQVKYKDASFKVVYLKNKNDNKSTSHWRINGKQIKPSMSIIFRTDTERYKLLKHLLEFVSSKFKNSYWTGQDRSLSGLGHIMFKVTYMSPDAIRNNETTLVPKQIQFHVVVKYKNENAFRSLPYSNNLLDRTVQSMIDKRKPDTSLEQQILYQLNDQLYKLGRERPVNLTIEGDSNKYEKIIGFLPGPSGAHADFVGIDEDGKESCFISHKDAGGPKSFQQYSGISSDAGDTIHNAEETKIFREIIANKESKDFDNQSFSRDIKDTQLQVRSVLGPDWNGGGTNVGNNNCSHFMQGYVDVILKKEYKLSKTNEQSAQITIRFGEKNIHTSNISSLINDNRYAPTLGARKTNENRSVTFGSDRVLNVRGGIFSSAYIKERKTNIELPTDE